MIRLSLAAVCVALATLCAPATGAATPARPWEDADVLFNQAAADYQQRGFAGIAPLAVDLESALSTAGSPIRKTFRYDDVTYVLVDSPLESQLASALSQGGDGRRVVRISDPYPRLSFLLGAYYNEVGRYDDAIRVMDLGLGAAPNSPMLVAEKGASLQALHRWPDALAQYEGGLALPDLPALDRARMLRGQGACFTETGRLDDAEAAYRASLELEPGNELARNELQYIAGLRAGRPAGPGEIVAPGRPPGT